MRKMILWLVLQLMRGNLAWTLTKIKIMRSRQEQGSFMKDHLLFWNSMYLLHSAHQKIKDTTISIHRTIHLSYLKKSSWRRMECCKFWTIQIIQTLATIGLTIQILKEIWRRLSQILMIILTKLFRTSLKKLKLILKSCPKLTTNGRNLALKRVWPIEN